MADVGSAAPQTLAVLRGDINKFDADGGRIGWLTQRAHCNNRVHALVLSSHRRTVLDRKSCRFDRFHDQTSAFILVRGRAFWDRYGAGNLLLDGYVLTAALQDQTTRVVAGFSDDDRASHGDSVFPTLVADERTALIRTSASVSRLVGKRMVPLFERTRPVGGYSSISLGESTIAVATEPTEGEAGPIEGSLEIHARSDGALLRVLPLAFVPRAISNSQIVGVDFTTDGNSFAITTYDVQDGRSIWTHIVPTLVEMTFVHGTLIVATEKRLVALEPAEGRERTLIRVSGRIADIDVAAGRLIWLEQIGQERFRVRSLPTPR